MPEMDGWEVGLHLRRIPRDRPAIIMLSAFAPDAVHKSEPDQIHDDYLIKPFDSRQLLSRIHALLDIEWVHEAVSEELPAISVAALAPSAIPSLRDLDELIRLGQIGYMRGIQEKLSEIDGNSPVHRDFTTCMRGMVDGFDLKRYVAALESIRSSHG
jgi:response regulator RpfG family c-di-GMP phosphodiesterase